MNGNITASVRPITSLLDTEKYWRSTELLANGSFFQSWNWVGAWLELLPVESRPKLFVLENKSRTIGVGIVIQKKISRRKIINSNCLFLNESGIPDLDALTIEHNGILTEKSQDKTTCVNNMISTICRDMPDWDEFIISGISGENITDYLNAAYENNLKVKMLDTKPYFYVDLDEIRASGKDYISCLSSNTRQQLRRTIKAYGGLDALSICQVTDVDEALHFYEKMKKLHQPYWQAKGYSGAFSDHNRDEFHKNLIVTGIPDGSVQLLKISTNKIDIGYLYNFVKGGVVYNYQGGFLYQDKPIFRPGMISHYMAIQYNINNCLNIYDFLAGDHRYKKSLSTVEGEMYWFTLQKSKLIFKIEESLQKLSCLFRTKSKN